MKRFLVCALGVALLAMPAAAQDATVWLQGTDGGNKVDVLVSQTAVVQLWVTIAGGSTMIGIDAITRGYDSAFGKNINFEVAGFNDQVNPGLMQRVSRGDVVNDLPNGNPDDYQYVGDDSNFPLSSSSGTAGPATFLLDEIIIHGIDNPANPTGLPSSDLLGFGLGAAAPGGFALTLTGFPVQTWQALDATVATGTGSLPGNPLTVNVDVPEPATLGMLMIGGLAAIRRRR